MYRFSCQAEIPQNFLCIPVAAYSTLSCYNVSARAELETILATMYALIMSLLGIGDGCLYNACLPQPLITDCTIAELIAMYVFSTLIALC